MSESATTGRSRGDSPRSVARLIGVLTLLTVLGGMYAQGYVAAQLIDWHDSAATATNILAHRNLYLSAVAVYLVEMACSIATAALYYVLLKPAGRSLSLVMLCLGLIANAIKVSGRVLFAAPLYLLGETRFHAFAPGVLNDLSLVLLLVNDHAAGIAMAFFGFQTVLAGWLMLRSTFLPRILGILSVIAGFAWLTHLWPPLGYRFGNYAILMGLVGVCVQSFWLIVHGVNEQQWHEQASANRL